MLELRADFKRISYKKSTESTQGEKDINRFKVSKLREELNERGCQIRNE
jgi:hypothetical protein